MATAIEPRKKGVFESLNLEVGIVASKQAGHPAPTGTQLSHSPFRYVWQAFFDRSLPSARGRHG